MSTIKYVRNFSALLLAALLFPAVGIAKSVDVKFGLLQTRTDVYTNVTVTTVMPAFICIQHVGGIGTIKVADLLDDALIRLEYKAAPKKDSGESLGAQVSAQVKKTFSRFDLSALEPFIRTCKDTIEKGFSAKNPNYNLIFVILGIAFVVHIIRSWLARLICVKADQKPDFLIWVPFLQWCRMYNLAGMSRIWIFVVGLPIGNFFVKPSLIVYLTFTLLDFLSYVVWCVKITRARGKHGFIALLMILPITNIFAWLYLAFSKGVPPKDEGKAPSTREPVMMTLETA